MLLHVIVVSVYIKGMHAQHTALHITQYRLLFRDRNLALVNFSINHSEPNSQEQSSGLGDASHIDLPHLHTLSL